MENALRVLREFVQDVEAVGLEQVKEEWPDILVTYHKSIEVLRPKVSKNTDAISGLSPQHQFTIRDKINKLDEHKNLNTKVKLIYEWVKTDQINLREFRHLLNQVSF